MKYCLKILLTINSLILLLSFTYLLTYLLGR